MSGCFLISSRPALRPSLASAKVFSHAFSSARSFCDLVSGSPVAAESVIDMVAINIMALKNFVHTEYFGSNLVASRHALSLGGLTSFVKKAATAILPYLSDHMFILLQLRQCQHFL